jgi:hypothetical protein
MAWVRERTISIVRPPILDEVSDNFSPYWQLRVYWCVAPSLTRWWICNLLVQLLLGLTRAVTLGSKSRRTHDHILLPHLRLPQPGGSASCYLNSQGTGYPSYTPRALGSLFVTSYDSLGYGEGILTHLHSGMWTTSKSTVLPVRYELNLCMLCRRK